MAVKQTGGSHDSDFILGFIDFCRLHRGHGYPWFGEQS
jgi:hypothetical protein